MVHERFIDAVRHRVPHARVVLARGSAIGPVKPAWSDVDFDVLVDEGEDTWPWWIEEDSSGTLTHISVAVASVSSWITGLGEPQDWAFGFPVAAPCRLLWAADSTLRVRFAIDTVPHPAGPPELEDTIEALGKARRAAAAGDPLRFWPALHEIGRLAPTVLRVANPDVPVATRRDALEAVLSLPNVPDGWRAGIILCLGLDRLATGIDEALAAARALVYGVVEIISSLPEERMRTVFDPWEVDTIVSGRLRRYLRHMP